MPTEAAEQGRRAMRAAAGNRRDTAAVTSQASSMSSSDGREPLWRSAAIRWTPAACGMVSSYVRPGTWQHLPRSAKQLDGFLVDAGTEHYGDDIGDLRTAPLRVLSCEPSDELTHRDRERRPSLGARDPAPDRALDRLLPRLERARRDDDPRVAPVEELREQDEQQYLRILRTPRPYPALGEAEACYADMPTSDYLRLPPRAYRSDPPNRARAAAREHLGAVEHQQLGRGPAEACDHADSAVRSSVECATHSKPATGLVRQVRNP